MPVATDPLQGRVDAFETARAKLVAAVDRDPVQAIQEYWMDLADLGVDADAEEIVATIVDHECARGDYEGCSPELELAYTEYLAKAHRALGGR